MKRISVIAVLALLISACSHYEELKSDPKESASGDDESHNAGQNCSSCHNKSGTEAAAEGWWTIAGTVFKSDGRAQGSATIELWEKPGKQGKLIKRLVTDDLGNFYTNQVLNFNGGCYPVVYTSSGEIQMTSAFNGGSCNSCHGVTESRIQIN
ncbi:MAG: hypothetical protein LCH37_04650 [Bacteroidetes bacterium]|nr:hypothetical protein [Bacteroidota bacterium]